jgi:hypothetical protein
VWGAYGYHGAHRAEDHPTIQPPAIPQPMPAAAERRAPVSASLLIAAMVSGAVGGLSSSAGIAWVTGSTSIAPAAAGPTAPVYTGPAEPAPIPDPTPLTADPPESAAPGADPAADGDPAPADDAPTPLAELDAAPNRAPSQPPAPPADVDPGPGPDPAPVGDAADAGDDAADDDARPPADRRDDKGQPAADDARTADPPPAAGRPCPATLDGSEPHVARAGQFLASRFDVPLSSVSGRRDTAVDPEGHPQGLALDFRVSRGVGDQLAAYAIDHRRQLGITYVIWQQRISIDGGPFQPMPDRGSDRDNHRDHVHVSFNRDPPSTPVRC